MKLKQFISESIKMTEKILDDLNKKILIITFTKKDGTERIMRCTSNLNKIPGSQHPNGLGFPKKGVKCVYDLKLGEWRSFRLDSVIKIEDDYNI